MPERSTTVVLVSGDDGLAPRLADSFVGCPWQLARAAGGLQGVRKTGEARPAALLVDFLTTLASGETISTGRSDGWERGAGPTLFDVQADSTKLRAALAGVPFWDTPELVPAVALTEVKEPWRVFPILDAGFHAVFGVPQAGRWVADLLSASPNHTRMSMVRLTVEAFFESYRERLRAVQPHSPITLALASIVRGFCHDAGDFRQTVFAVCAIMKERIPASFSLEHRLLADLLTRAAQNAEMGGDLYDLMRAFDGEPGLYQPRVSLEELPLFLQSLLDVLPEAKALRLTHTIACDDRKLSLPRFLGRHLLEPLLHNAVRATAGAGELHLTVSTSPGGQTVGIALEDSGRGWQGRLEEIRASLLQGPLPRCDRGDSSRPRGHGLRIVRHTLHIMKGELVLGESQLGGALVEVVLPRGSFDA